MDISDYSYYIIVNWFVLCVYCNFQQHIWKALTCPHRIISLQG